MISPDKVEGARLLVTGKFDAGQIITRHTGKTFNPPDALKPQIEAMWEPKAKLGYTAGPLARLDDFRLSGGNLQLTFSNTNFKDYLGARGREDLKRFGYEGLPNPLSVSIGVVTADNMLLVTEKLKGDAAGSLDAVGGYLHPVKDTDYFGRIILFTAAVRESAEEVLYGTKKVDDVDIVRAMGTLTGLTCVALCYELGSTEDLSHPVANLVLRTNFAAKDYIHPTSPSEVKIHITDPSGQSPIYPSTESLVESFSPRVEPDGLITIGLVSALLRGEQPPSTQHLSLSQL